MRFRIAIMAGLAVLAAGLWFGGFSRTFARSTVSAAVESGTETVYSTFRVKDGKEAEFAEVHRKAWETYRKFRMVLTQPHVIVRGQEESGKVYFVEILTWKDHDAPDHAGPEVHELWKQMEALCEPRDGHRGIEFTEVRAVEPLPRN